MFKEIASGNLEDMDAWGSAPGDRFMQTCFYCPLPKRPERGIAGRILRWLDIERFMYWRVSVEEYADTLKEHYEVHEAMGYEVIQVVPIQMASHTGGIFGLRRTSITRGAVVIGRLLEDERERSSLSRQRGRRRHHQSRR